MKNVSAQKIFDYSVYAILLLLPLFFLPFLNLSYELPKQALFRSGVLLMLLSFVWRVFREKKLIFGDILMKPEVRRAIGLYLFVIILAGLFSITPHLSFWGSYFRGQGLYSLMHYFLFFVLLVLGFRNYERAFYFIFWGFVLSVFYGILQYFGIDFVSYDLEEISNGRTFAGFGHPNYWAYWAVLLIFPLLVICNSSLSVLLILAVLFLTMSRGALVGFFAGFVFFGIMSGIFFRKWKIFLAFCISLLVAVFLLIFPGDFLEGTRFSGSDSNLRSVHSREIIWKGSFEMISNRALFGYGLDNFQIVFPKYLTKEIYEYESLDSVTDRAHNLILDILAQSGLFGLAVYLFIWWVILKFSFRKLRTVGEEGGRKIIAVLSGLIALSFANLFGFSVTVHFVFEAFLLAYLIHLLSDKNIHENLSFLRKSSFTFLGKIILLFFIVISLFGGNLFPVLADFYGAKALSELSERKAEPIARSLLKAVYLNPHQDYYYYFLTEVFSGAGEQKSALLALEKAGYYNSYQDYYYYFLKGKISSEEEYFEKAYQKAPIFAAILLEWGKLLLEKDKCEQALKKFNQYLDLMPEYLDGDASKKARIFHKENPDFERVFEYKVSAISCSFYHTSR